MPRRVDGSQQCFFEFRGLKLLRGEHLEVTICHPSCEVKELSHGQGLDRGLNLSECGGHARIITSRRKRSRWASRVLPGSRWIGDGFETCLIPDNKSIIRHSNLLDPGKDEVIEFNAPIKPGDYPYICSFPGHYLIMSGVLHLK